MSSTVAHEDHHMADALNGKAAVVDDHDASSHNGYSDLKDTRIRVVRSGLPHLGQHAHGIVAPWCK